MTAGRGQEYRNDSRRYSGWQGARVIESSGRLDTGWIRTGYKLDTGAGQGAGAGGDGEPVEASLKIRRPWREPDRGAP